MTTGIKDSMKSDFHKDNKSAAQSNTSQAEAETGVDGYWTNQQRFAALQTFHFNNSERFNGWEE